MSTDVLPLVELRWGEALAIVRDRSGLKLRPVAAAIERYWPASTMSLSRLELLDGPPPDARRRTLAAMALLTYGWTDLGAFGLSERDLPKGNRLEGLSDLLIREVSKSRELADAVA